MEFLKHNRSLVIGAVGATAAAGVLYYLLSPSESTADNDAPRSMEASKGAAKVKETAQSPQITEQEISLKAFAVPKVGTGLDLQPDYCGGLKMLAKKIDELGTGIGYIDMYGTPIVILCEPEYVRYSLAHNVYNQHWGGIAAASRAFFGENVLFVLMGDKWRKLRNTMKFALAADRMKKLQTDLFAYADRLCDLLEKFVGKEVDMNLLLAMYHLDAIGKGAYDYEFHCLDEFEKTRSSNAIVDSFEFLLSELPRRSLAPDQSVLGDYDTDNEDNRKWKKAASTVRSQVAEALTKKLKSRKEGMPKRNDLLDALVDVYHEEAGGDKELFQLISDNLVEILFAGYNTNVGTIATALHYISQNPAVLAKLQKEVDKVIPDDFAPGDEIDTSKLVNCKNVFYETLRLSPPAPLVVRFTQEDIVLKDKYIIPRNTSVWHPAEYLQAHPVHWGADASEFNPDRWNKENPSPPGSYIPFSHGPRECIGKHFALLEAVSALGFLVKKFEFDVPQDYMMIQMFNGFGYRPFDTTTKKVCVRLIPKRRK